MEKHNELKTPVSPTPESAAKPKYQPPMVKLMDESEVLTAFQVTAAGATLWWVA